MLGLGHPRNNRAKVRLLTYFQLTTAVSSDLTCPAQIRPELLQLQLNQPLSSSRACNGTSPLGLMSLKSSPSTVKATILAAPTTV